MLERTAASLEACNLQRVLPRQVRPTKTRRYLQTGFWQHGASALETSSLWSTVPPCPETAAENAAPNHQPGALLAPIHLLDFLYPKATHPQLRRLYPGLPRTYGRPDLTKSIPERRYMSSVTTGGDGPDQSTGTQLSGTEPALDVSSAPRRDDVSAQDPVLQAQQATPLPAPDENSPSKSEEQENETNSQGERGRGTYNSRDDNPDLMDLVVEQAQQDLADAEKRLQLKAATELDALLSSHGSQDTYRIWDLYCQLDSDQQPPFRFRVIRQFMTSISVVDMGRAATIFQQVPASQLDNDLLAAGVQLYLNMDDEKRAMQTLKAGFKQGFSGGLDELFVDALSGPRFATVIQAWLAFHNSPASMHPTRKSYRRIPPMHKLSALENLAERYIAFEQHLALQGASLDNSRDTTPRIALDALRLKLGKLALRQVCPPNQARVILKGLGDIHIYYEYLTLVFRQRKYASWSSMSKVELAGLYKEYSKMAGAKPSPMILDGMFDVLYPWDPETIVLLYNDWHRFHGGLSNVRRRKYMAFFAKAGDVATVKNLWEEWSKDDPKSAGESSGRYSLVNVHAQVGDIESAKKELTAMVKNNACKPDIAMMNTLLKSYVRANDYDGALECFSRILDEKHHPDSFTFTHIMTMSAKKGDVENTLKFFNLAQETRIPVTEGMVLALVLAYGYKGQLAAAESICVKLSDQGITCTLIWNQLVNFFGMEGKLDDCYRLLQDMKRYGLEWDQQTHEFLFRALAKVGQVQEAFSLLKRAHRSRLFVVNSQHYAVLMVEAARRKDSTLVQSLASRMRRAGLKMNFNAHVAFMSAYMNRAPHGDDLVSLAQGMTDLLQEMVPSNQRTSTQSVTHKDFDVSLKALSTGDPRILALQTQQISRAILLMVDLGKYDKVEEMVELYTAIFPKFAGSLPPSVGAAVMLTYWKLNNTARLRETWTEVWAAALRQAQGPNGKVYPAHEYDLNRPLHIMFNLFRRLDDADALLTCIKTVTAAGFKLTSSNWEIAIRYLADMDRWWEAYEYCEEMLMPMWSGWQPGKQSLAVRRSLKNARAIRPPSKEVILTLQKQWLEMNKIRSWSGDITEKLKEVHKRFPKLHYAMLSAASKGMIADVHKMTRWNIYQAIMLMIRPFTAHELGLLKRILEEHLYAQKSQKGRVGRIAARSTTARLAATGADMDASEQQPSASAMARERALYDIISQQFPLRLDEEEYNSIHHMQVREREKRLENPKKYFPGITPESLAAATRNREARIRRLAERAQKVKMAGSSRTSTDPRHASSGLTDTKRGAKKKPERPAVEDAFSSQFSSRR